MDSCLPVERLSCDLFSLAFPDANKSQEVENARQKEHEISEGQITHFRICIVMSAYHINKSRKSIVEEHKC